ncbi:MAG TPA: hypothetical protein VFM05_12265, partial [Candidatus Saccharimonadales bacterium]|nr:hypothetical protein [Candidatus Saccharimonadales bacterium]
MRSKKEPSKQVLDITRPKKRSADVPSAPQLVIPKRSIIVPVSEAEAPAPEPAAPKQTVKDVQPKETS